MASRLRRELSYGSVEIYYDEVLGVGAYGKVCKAKCGQLPCAAKLLHESIFHDPETHKFISKFLQECQFLSNIKHPNIVQYLGTISDPRSHRPVLLMELMDESLTKFLKRSICPLPYHSQLNICHDVALALAYLHSNAIIHRDLSSNNVLLTGEGSRAKVTDFGMSKLMDMNPHMTPLTKVPGTPAYMPPEARNTPPHYSSKLDCFSHGVLTLQVITRNFPNPGNATTVIESKRFPTGRAFVPIPEVKRRKIDIDLVEPSHPLLPISLDCLNDRDTERPSADELCRRLASLKRQPYAWYMEGKPSSEEVSEQSSEEGSNEMEESSAEDYLDREAEEENSSYLVPLEDSSNLEVEESSGEEEDSEEEDVDGSSSNENGASPEEDNSFEEEAVLVSSEQEAFEEETSSEEEDSEVVSSEQEAETSSEEETSKEDEECSEEEEEEEEEECSEEEEEEALEEEECSEEEEEEEEDSLY